MPENTSPTALPRTFACTWLSTCGAARMMTAWIAWYEGAHRLRKIAAVLRLRSQGHISVLIRAAEQEIARRPELQRRLGIVYASLA